jgi:biopolymer transport protein ExbD
MSFKIKRSKNVPIELISLMDMTFILLIFFLVTSLNVKTLPLRERSLQIPTPENKPGRAQIVIQIIDENQLIWLDESANADVTAWDKELFYLLSDQKNREIVQRLIQKNTMDNAAFDLKMRGFIHEAKMNRNKTYFTVIRCPDQIPYTAVMKIISDLSQADNVEYGCLGGSADDFFESKITTGTYQGKTVLKIDF